MKRPTVVLFALLIAATSGCSGFLPGAPGGILRQSDLDESAIHAAGRSDRHSFDVARKLGANVFAVDRHGDNAVLAAVRGRDTALLRELLQLGIDPDVRGSVGFTPLTYATTVGDERSVRLLLSHGANPNLRNSLSDTPLHIAAEFGRERILTLLLAAGARIDATNEYGETPLVVSIAANRMSTFLALLGAGASVEVTDRNGNSPLMLALLADREPMAFRLAQAGALAGARGREYSPLRLARGFGYARVVAVLEQRGAPD